MATSFILSCDILTMKIFVEVINVIGLKLNELPLFKDLSDDEIDHFIKQTGTRIKNYDCGSRILKAYEPNSKIGLLVQGEAQIVAEDRMGNEAIGHQLERGAIFGSTSAILAMEWNQTSIDALTDVIVMWIPYKSLIGVGVKLGRIHGVVMKNFLEAFCKKNVLMMQKIELLSQKSLRERIILYLLQREKRQNTDKVQVPGRIQMAKELECNRSALTREIGNMQKDGLIMCGKNYMLLDKDKIQ